MTPSYAYDHLHLRSRDPKATAEYYHRMFDARIIESVSPDGQPRIDLDLGGLAIFIAAVAPDARMPSAPAEPYVGLDHFGLRVPDLEAAAAELRRRGATFTMEPRTLRPGLRIAFVQAPENVRIEVLERTGAA